jgi:hypothetical protein
MRFSALRIAPLFLTPGLLLMGCGDALESGDAIQSYAISGAPTDTCGGGKNDEKGFHSKCRHYKERERHSAAQAGLAKMTTRALMDVKKVTLIEATTGTFDGAQIPPGWFDSVKIRIDKLKQQKNWDDSEVDFDQTKTGYFSVTYPTPAPATTKRGGGDEKGDRRPTLKHGQTMSITGVVKGVDPRRAVIQVDDQVKYRPDLSVARIDTAGAKLGLPANIIATIHEGMGDLGAISDCVLSVDGAAADRANGVWVDKSGTVSCHFAYTFTMVGTHKLHVDVVNVRPADYDMSNNGADATINVVQDFAFSGAVSDGTYTTSYREQVLDASSNVLYEQNSSASGSSHSVTITGAWGQVMTFPLAALSVTETSAGATWTVVNLNNLAGQATSAGATCAAGSDATGSSWVTLCSSSGGGSPTSQITVSEFAGDVTYHSDMACRQTSSFYDCADGYTWNSDGTGNSGVRHPLDGTMTAQLSVTDAAGQTVQGSPVIALQPYATAQDQALTCTPATDGTRDCTEQHYSEQGMRGTVN